MQKKKTSKRTEAQRLKVTFRPKSSWQKDDCLCCGKKANLEAVLSVGRRFSAQMRCCRRLACKRFAAKLARQSAQGPLAKSVKRDKSCVGRASDAPKKPAPRMKAPKERAMKTK